MNCNCDCSFVCLFVCFVNDVFLGTKRYSSVEEVKEAYGKLSSKR